MSENATSEAHMEESKSFNPSKVPDLTPIVNFNIQTIKGSCEYSLHEYMRLQALLDAEKNCSQGAEVLQVPTRRPDLEERLRQQSAIVLENLNPLREEVRVFGRSLAAHRMRTWIIGGSVASATPLLAALLKSAFPGPIASSVEISSALVSSRKMENLTSIVLYSLSFLYVVQNELSIRIARTVYRRLSRLYAKVEQKKERVTEKDMEVVRGWRWKVLLWGS